MSLLGMIPLTNEVTILTHNVFTKLEVNRFINMTGVYIQLKFS